MVASEHLTAEEIEFLRWKAERWMKCRHLPAVFAHDPLFVIRNALRMLAFNFRGSTVKSFLGMEQEFKAFERYRTLRRAERNYV